MSTLQYRIQLVLAFEGSAMWFLPAMFMASVLFFLTLKLGNYQMILAVVSVVTWMLCPRVDGIYGAFFRAIPGFGFIVIGNRLYSLYINKKNGCTLLFASVVHLIATIMNPTVSIASHDFGNPLLYVIESSLGTFVIYQIVLRINVEKSRVALIGKASVLYLCLHDFVIQIIRLVDYKTINVFPRLGWFEGILLASIVILLIYIFVPFVVKYFRWTIGIKKQ